MTDESTERVPESTIVKLIRRTDIEGLWWGTFTYYIESDPQWTLSMARRDPERLLRELLAWATHVQEQHAMQRRVQSDLGGASLEYYDAL